MSSVWHNMRMKRRDVLVCLTSCGHGRGNRARLSGWAASPSMRPLGVYIYAVGPQSCATRLIFAGSAPLAAAKQAAHGTLGSSARCSGPRPLSRSMRRRSRRLRGDTRRNALSVNTPPRLATCLTAHPANRVAACRSVRHTPPRPLPHLPQGAFVFVASAAARQIRRAALGSVRTAFRGKSALAAISRRLMSSI